MTQVNDSRRAVTAKLQAAILLAQQIARDAGIDDLADPRIESDPENPVDWWVAIGMKVRGTAQQVLELYQQFMKQFTSCVDSEERRHIRIEMSLQD